MKEKLQCETCGGNLIHKENDLFVCESCGLGYKITDKSTPYRDPHVDNTVIINGIQPDKIARLSSEFNSFCYRRENYR